MRYDNMTKLAYNYKLYVIRLRGKKKVYGYVLLRPQTITTYVSYLVPLSLTYVTFFIYAYIDIVYDRSKERSSEWSRVSKLKCS